MLTFFFAYYEMVNIHDYKFTGVKGVLLVY